MAYETWKFTNDLNPEILLPNITMIPISLKSILILSAHIPLSLLRGLLRIYYLKIHQNNFLQSEFILSYSYLSLSIFSLSLPSLFHYLSYVFQIKF